LKLSFFNRKNLIPNFPKSIQSFKYAFNGFIHLFKNENNFKIHILAALLTILIGVWVRFSYIEWIVIIFCIGLVLTMEGLNSAIEKTIDLISPKFNTKAGIAKDISAAAVLIATLMAVVVGMIVLIHHLV
jgi:diacylglycerol kinase